MIGGIIHLVWKGFINAIIVMVCISLIFISYKANQPMTVAGAPRGMTYVQFIQDRLEAAKTVQPSRCGWGMMLSLALIGPVYSVDYTWVATHPDSFLAKVTAPDPDIPKGVAEASWYEIPGIWWNVVERLSWTMLAKTHPGCHFRPVAQNGIKSSPLPPDPGRTLGSPAGVVPGGWWASALKPFREGV